MTPPHPLNTRFVVPTAPHCSKPGASRSGNFAHLQRLAGAWLFGLMGGALRLLGRPDQRLRSLGDRRFLTTAVVLMAVNAAAGLVGLAPGMEGARIAWEAHAFGFVCGALLIGPWAKAFGSRGTPFASPADLGDPHA